MPETHTTESPQDEIRTVPETAYEGDKKRIRLDRSALLHEDWDGSRGKGFRFYQISDGVGDHPPLYALSTYGRQVDEETGETVEEETILQLGELSLDLAPFQPDKDYLSDHSAFEDTYLPTLLGEVNTHYSAVVEELITQALDVDLDSPAPVNGGFHVELRGDELSVYFERGQVVAALATRDGGSDHWKDDEWAGYLDAVNDYNEVDRDYRTGLCRARISLEPPEMEWRFRAVEYQHKGVFKHKPALAAVKALRDHTSVPHTQTEVAELLGTNQGNVSRQVAELEEWEERVDWMAENA